mmetsp:Transcript_20718/g.58777  ORF Transcript_20718/g.58777 Transcript_20718/m.58777 type:complete len:85 (-) Transcript_20718:1284-1538(-)
MNVVVNIGRNIVVDHLCYVGDVESTTRNICRHHDGSCCAFESTQCFLTFALTLVTMNRACRETFVAKHILDIVARPLCFDENQN